MRVVGFVALTLGCAPAVTRDAPTQGASHPEGAYVEEPPAPVERVTVPAEAPETTCEPLPSEGDPCSPDDGYCVVDWGEPGGHSTALWCVDGRWEIELERNLD